MKLTKINEIPTETDVITLIPDTSKLDNKIVLKTTESVFLLNIGDIVRCEADGNYTHFYTLEKQKITISKTLKEYEFILNQKKLFFRIHHSYLINLNYMERFDKKDGGMVVMKDKTLIPVSIRKRNELLVLLEKL